MKNFIKFLYPTMILSAICLIVALALSSANAVTADRIAELNAEKTEKAMSRVLKAETYTEKNGGEFDYYEASSGGEIKGFIFITSASGYGGEVRVMTAILNDGNKSINAIEILDVSGETPGLGQNATNKEFYSQYEGKSGSITVLKSGADSDNGEINAITGATITSRAVTKAVNKALELCGKINTEAGSNE